MFVKHKQEKSEAAEMWTRRRLLKTCITIEKTGQKRKATRVKY